MLCYSLPIVKENREIQHVRIFLGLTLRMGACDTLSEAGEKAAGLSHVKKLIRSWEEANDIHLQLYCLVVA